MPDPTPRRRTDPVIGHVVRTQRLTPHLVRLVVGGPGLAAFQPSPHADAYVKLLFVPPGERRLLPDGRVDGDALRSALPDGEVPRLRAYTVRAFDPGALELTLDLVVHGDEGLAGPWAHMAAGGEEVLVQGPGGAWSPPDEADHHLLVGDCSALPAIAVALERMRPDARGLALIEVEDGADELALDHPAGVDVRWVHARPGAPGESLLEAALAWPWPAGIVSAFVHGEAGTVRALRRYLRVDRAVPSTLLSVSGYWRLGVDDEGWRAGKRAWNASVDADEQAARAV